MHGLSISTAVVLASVQGIVMNRNADLLLSSVAKLISDWAKCLLNTMGYDHYVKRKCCSKVKVDFA